VEEFFKGIVLKEKGFLKGGKVFDGRGLLWKIRVFERKTFGGRWFLWGKWVFSWKHGFWGVFFGGNGF
jgi:hypothetical protein